MKELRWVVLVAVACLISVMQIKVSAAPPDPWVRMTHPEGCSGGVIHASREYGIWVATCRHCVSRPWSPVTLRFFKDGHTSGPFLGYCLASHPIYDCSVVVVPPGAYKYPEFPIAVPLSASGASPGDTVFAVGSYAGGTVAPASRKVSVTSLQSGGYGLRLNDSAWGGHSGGAIVSTDMEMVGVLWGTGNGYSSVTTSRAIIETLQIAAGQASVQDEVSTTLRPVIEVSGTPAKLETWAAELADDPRMGRIDWQQGNSSGRVRFTWLSPAGKTWYVDGWPGYDRFINRMLRCRGFPKDCPDIVQWGPNPGAGRSPWTVPIPPNIIGNGSSQRNAEIERLNAKIKELIESSRVTAREMEDEARRLRLDAEDDVRRLKNEFNDIRQLAPEFADRRSPPVTDGHPFTLATEWIKDTRERDKELVEFANSISTSRVQEPKPSGDDYLKWVACGIALLLGGGYLGKKMK